MVSISPMRDPRGYPSDEQVEQALNACDNLRDYVMIRILSRTGLRISELLGIRVKDILFDEHQVIIGQLKKRAEAYRNVYLDSETIEILNRYVLVRGLKEEDTLFDIKRTNFNKVLKAISIRGEVGNIGNKEWLHPHHFRHFFVMRGIKKGIDIRKLQLLVGHSSYNTTAAYLQYGSKELEDEYKRMFSN